MYVIIQLLWVLTFLVSFFFFSFILEIIIFIYITILYKLYDLKYKCLQSSTNVVDVLQLSTLKKEVF
jgi:hypothetical protein